MSKMSAHASAPRAWRSVRAVLAGSAALVMLPAVGVHARTWTSADRAKTLEVGLRSYDAATGTLTVILSNGRSLNFNQDKLSEGDLAWLKKNSGQDTISGGSGAARIRDTNTQIGWE